MEPIYLASDDGTRLVCWDFGGRGTPVLMVHGTGLHGRCWGPVARLLDAGRFRVVALDMRGHGASGRSPDGTYNWGRFADDVSVVVRHLRANRASGVGDVGGIGGVSDVDGAGDGAGLIGVGHSAGASALLLAEAARPGYFSGIWGWEPIVSVPGSDLRRARGADLADRARRRRAAFSSVDEAKEHFEGRGMFSEFSAGALDAFLSGGLVPGTDGGVNLACDPEDEARVYEAVAAGGAWEALARVRCPVRVVGGSLSPAVPPAELAQISAQLPAGTMAVMPSLGHFGPFQDPAAIAADIAAWISAGAPLARSQVLDEARGGPSRAGAGIPLAVRAAGYPGC